LIEFWDWRNDTENNRTTWTNLTVAVSKEFGLESNLLQKHDNFGPPKMVCVQTLLSAQGSVQRPTGLPHALELSKEPLRHVVQFREPYQISPIVVCRFYFPGDFWWILETNLWSQKILQVGIKFFRITPYRPSISRDGIKIHARKHMWPIIIGLYVVL